MATVRKVIEVPDSPVVDQAPQSFMKVGQLCNLPLVGRTVTNYKYLGTDGVFLKFEGDVNIAPNTAIVLIPVAQLEAVGLVGAYE